MNLGKFLSRIDSIYIYALQAMYHHKKNDIMQTIEKNRPTRANELWALDSTCQRM